ncbi:MAG TPA: hypothetical protein VGV88_13085 [Candidatus Dormibacteraeota bacterium]|nr:hypothetical protein [Candidatus Dormibacteraeota bacterium]
MADQPKLRVVFSAAVLAALCVALAVGGTTSTRELRHVDGTLQVAGPLGPAVAMGGGGSRLPSAQLPTYVSTATTHAALFIDGAATPAGQATSCSASNGTGTGCTISWSANLSVPAMHSFAVEIDTGATVVPHNTVLAEGKASYTVFPGNNTLGSGGNGSPLSLNGVVNTYFYSISGCAGASCSGSVTPADAASYSIFYAGALTTPTPGVPTSGNVFDNAGINNTSPFTFASDTPSIGTMTGTAQAPWTTTGTNVMTILGVNASDLFPFQVTCVAGANGKFGVVSGGGALPYGNVTASELSGLSPAVLYPAGPGGLDTTNLFTCANGVALSATGTIITN